MRRPDAAEASSPTSATGSQPPTKALVTGRLRRFASMVRAGAGTAGSLIAGGGAGLEHLDAPATGPFD